MKLALKDLKLAGKKVVMRVDFNVPIQDGIITDDTRIQAALHSIRYVLEHKASLILLSHLGRPKGEKKTEFSLKPVAARLEELLGKKVQFIEDCRGQKVQKAAAALRPGDVLLLENVRFYKGEEKPESDPAFAKELASLGDYYVNEAFGSAHRAHASTVKIAEHLPPPSCAYGFLMEKELKYLGALIKQPKRPFYALIGGAKISTKIGVLNSLIDKVDALFLGGGMVYTFLKAQGIPIGDSICEDDFLEVALEVMRKCETKNIPLYIPQDIVVTDDLSGKGEVRVVACQEGIPPGFEGVDIGPKSIAYYKEKLVGGKTILWNGPFGVFEVPPFDRGTQSMAAILGQVDGVVVVGGGDSVSAIKKGGGEAKVTHLSTGGGAALEYVQYGTLPGIEALHDVLEGAY